MKINLGAKGLLGTPVEPQREEANNSKMKALSSFSEGGGGGGWGAIAHLAAVASTLPVPACYSRLGVPLPLIKHFLTSKQQTTLQLQPEECKRTQNGESASSVDLIEFIFIIFAKLQSNRQLEPH